MKEETILTKHPSGKTGRNISREKYRMMRSALLAALRKKPLTHTELFREVGKRLKGKFSGNVSWYAETLKLDLEARKLIVRTATKPQKYKLK